MVHPHLRAHSPIEEKPNLSLYLCQGTIGQKKEPGGLFFEVGGLFLALGLVVSNGFSHFAVAL